MLPLQFILFFITLYLLGRGIFYLSHRLIKYNFTLPSVILDQERTFFYPIIALFFIGNFAVIINFFTGVDNIYFLLIPFALIMYNFANFKLPEFKVQTLLNFLVIPSLLSISSIGLGLHPDTGLYHLNYQNWIRSEKIVFGLSNISERFGYSSIYDYISSFLWLENNFILLHFLNLSFITIFFTFISNNLFSKNKGTFFNVSFLLILFGLLDNIGYAGGRNGFIYIEGIGKQDVAFAIIFFITNIFLINAITTKSFNKIDLVVISLLLIFTIQIRVYGIYSLIVFLYYYLNFSKFNFKNIFSNILYLTPSLILSFFWMLKNFIITSCLFFPVEITCFTNVRWNKFEHAENAAYIIQDFYYGLPTENGLFSWYRHWMSSPENSNMSKNFLFSWILLYLLVKIFYVKKFKFSIFQTIFFTIYLIINIYSWIYNSPTLRLAMGLIFLLVGIIGIPELEIKYKNKFTLLSQNRFLLIILFITCISLVPRVYKYNVFLADPFQSSTVITDTIKTIPNPIGWGELPEIGTECEVNLNCIPAQVEVELTATKYFNYKIFIPPKVWTKYGS